MEPGGAGQDSKPRDDEDKVRQPFPEHLASNDHRQTCTDTPVGTLDALQDVQKHDEAEEPDQDESMNRDTQDDIQGKILEGMPQEEQLQAAVDEEHIFPPWPPFRSLVWQPWDPFHRGYEELGQAEA